MPWQVAWEWPSERMSVGGALSWEVQSLEARPSEVQSLEAQSSEVGALPWVALPWVALPWVRPSQHLALEGVNESEARGEVGLLRGW